MEKLCIDVRGFSEEKKKRVQDAFFSLGIYWSSVGSRHGCLDASSYGNVRASGHTEHYLMMRRDVDFTFSDEESKYAVTYAQLMQKAGLDESDPDAVKLQPGDYTTREEIIAYAERERLTLEQAYQRLCDAFVGAGYNQRSDAIWYGDRDCFGVYNRNLHLHKMDEGLSVFSLVFTRHLTPEQILGEVNPSDSATRKNEISAATGIPSSVLFGNFEPANSDLSDDVFSTVQAINQCENDIIETKLLNHLDALLAEQLRRHTK